MDLYVGTSGYGYKEWKGPFYPEGLADGEMLRYYGERLNAVEVNNTFYRMPSPAVLESWAAQVPDAFRFSIKASRRITHHKRLAGVEEEMGYLLGALDALGDRLGVLLVQLPPYLQRDLELLGRFLGLLGSVPAALEFRHESWSAPDVHELLRRHGVAWCHADSDGSDGEATLVSTAAWGYLRLRRAAYTDADLERWAGRIRSQAWDRAFVFFKHEDAGAGPHLAARFTTLAEG